MNNFTLITAILLMFSNTVHAEQTNLIEFSWADFDNWYYKKTRLYQGWKYIVIHHSATNAGSLEAFHKFHTKQGYGGIAYHFVIGNGHGMQDGEVQETFRWKQQISGTHVTVNSWKHNVFGIGICLVGNLEEQPPTKAQMKALKRLVANLQEKYTISSNNILGHKHVAYDDASGKKEQTACPGKKMDIRQITRRNNQKPVASTAHSE